MDKVLKYVLDNKISMMVYSDTPLKEIFKEYDQSKLVYVTDYCYPIEDILNDPSDNRTIIYKVSDDILWNKVYTLLKMKNKHMILVTEYDSHSKISMWAAYKEVFRGVLAL